MAVASSWPASAGAATPRADQSVAEKAEARKKGGDGGEVIRNALEQREMELTGEGDPARPCEDAHFPRFNKNISGGRCQLEISGCRNPPSSSSRCRLLHKPPGRMTFDYAHEHNHNAPRLLLHCYYCLNDAADEL